MSLITSIARTKRLFFLLASSGWIVCGGMEKPVGGVHRLTDSHRGTIHSVGPVWRVPDDQIRRTPASGISLTHQHHESPGISSGVIEIPPGNLFLGVDLALKSRSGTDSTRVLIHLWEDTERLKAVEGFPVTIPAGSERTVLCRHRYNPSPLVWRAELRSPPEDRRDPGGVIEIRGRYAPAKSLRPGCQYLRASGETRPSLLFTPGTAIAMDLPDGDGWVFQTGIAQPKRGCAVRVVLRSSRGDSLLAMLKVPDWSWVDSSFTLPILSEGDSIFFHCPGTDEGGGVLMLGDPVIRRAETSPSRRPNILMISLDTVRADALEPWSKQDLSPGIGAFARNSTVCMNAYAPAPVTDASHRSFFSGLHANRHTLLGNERGSSPPHMRMLAEVMGDDGYRTGGFTDGGLISTAYGFHRGFDRYWEYSGDPRNKFHLRKILRRAARWIKDESLRYPWFAFVHTYQAHSPYVFHEKTGMPSVNVSVLARMSEDIPLTHQATLNSHKIPTERRVMELVRNHYRSEIAYLDKHISSFLDGLSDKGFLDNTIVVLFSDHGEGFGEHGLLGHNNAVYEEQTRVPLIIRFPGGEYAGRELNTIVRIIDVYPTILDYLGIPVEPELDGRSLLPEIRSCGGEHRTVLTHQLWHSSVTVWPYKLITGRNGFTTKVFDLSVDPDEEHDILTRVNGALVDSLKELLVHGLVESEPGWLITISRSRSTECSLSLTSRDCSEWSLFFTEHRDHVKMGPDRLSLSLVPSAVGSVSLFVPRIRGVALETGNERKRIDDEGDWYSGDVRLHITRCRGKRQDVTRDGSRHPAPDGHEERLRALGYLQ